VTIPQATYIQLRRIPPEDEQGNARNMLRILINVLYVNKQEFCASSWKSTKVFLCFRFSHQNITCTGLPLHMGHTPHAPHKHNSITRKHLVRNEVYKALLIQFSPLPSNFPPLIPKFIPHHHIL
jgi:hypothetical protein